MSESWDDYAEGWDENPGVAQYSKLAFESLQRTLPIEGLRVLDFGCGTGQLTEKLSPLAKTVIAIDLSEKMVDMLKQKKNNLKLDNVIAVAGDILEEDVLGLESFQTPFDLIVASSVCAFLPEFEETLKRLKTLLSTNGVFIQWDWERPEDQDGTGFTVQELSTAYQNLGLHVRYVGPAFALAADQGAMPVLMGVVQKN